MHEAATNDSPVPRGGAGEVFAVFLRLGLTSFGGPIAHLGYFRAEFVDRKRWIGESAYAELVALAQFLPGPSSSQVGFALGLRRAGLLGALAAFTAFTSPSAVALVALASGAAVLDGPVADGALSGLTVVAVAVVALAVLSMARTLTPDLPRAAIAVGALVIVVVLAGPLGQVAAIAAGALAGAVVCRRLSGTAPGESLGIAVSKRAGAVALALAGILLVTLPVLAALVPHPAIAQLSAFSRAGALVFGGGHVVLPLLEAEVVSPGWVASGDFVAGYAAAQAVPGPLFTFAGYLGALAEPGPGGIAGAALALVAIFLPGFLVLVGVLPFWEGLRRRAGVRAVVSGASAAVVGILAAALYDPLFTSAISGPPTLALAVVCFVLLAVAKVPPWGVVLFGAAAGILLALL